MRGEAYKGVVFVDHGMEIVHRVLYTRVRLIIINLTLVYNTLCTMSIVLKARSCLYVSFILRTILSAFNKGIGQEWTLAHIIQTRQWRWLGHVCLMPSYSIS